jgi:lipoprotein NlpI
VRGGADRAAASPLLALAQSQAFVESPHQDAAEAAISKVFSELSLLDTAQPGKPGEADRRTAAQNYWRLGNAYSDIGMHALSASAFEQALALAPGTAEFKYDLAIEQADADQMAEGERTLKEALAQSPDYAQGLDLAAFYYWTRGDAAQALTWSQRFFALPADADSRAYTALILLLAAQATGADAAAALQAIEYTAPDREWPQPIIEFLIGTIDEAALAQAAAADPAQLQERLCEALYYTAAQRELRGDVDGARHYYFATLDTRVVAFREHRGAELALSRLSQRAAH